MSQGPLTLSMILPKGMSEDTFYTIIAVVVAGLALALSVLPSVLKKRNRNARRVRMLQERRAELRGEMMKGRRRKAAPDGSMNLMRRVVMKFNLLKSQGVAQVQTLLIEAGMRSKDAPVVYAFFSLVTPIALLIVGLIVFAGVDWSENKYRAFRYVIPIALTYLGLKIPHWFVTRRRKKRYIALQRSLSDTLDLMTICAEAGLSLSMALDRVSRELGLSYPEMAEELALTSTELGFLPDRNKALVNFTERVKLPEIRGIVNVLIQTEKYGTPIAQAMRVLASEFREQRMLRAENKAAKLPALMTLPMIVFILPTLFIVMLTPAVLRVIDTVK